MSQAPLTDIERWALAAVKGLLLALAVLLLILLPILAWADPDLAAGDLTRLRLAIARAPALSPALAAAWQKRGLAVAQRTARAGAGRRVVLEMAQLALDNGWSADQFARLCRRLKRSMKPGIPPRETARNLVWQTMAWGPTPPATAQDLWGWAMVIDRRLFLDTLASWLRAPYAYGGESRWGVDCSGLVKRVFAAHGLHLPRVSSQQAIMGRPVPRRQMRLGDLVYFRRPGRGVFHIGIYLADGWFIHSRRGQGVVMDTIRQGRYRRYFAGARRVAWFTAG